MNNAEYEYGVVFYKTPQELHRGPMTWDEADEFMRAIDSSGEVRPGIFYIVERPRTRWSRYNG